MVVELEGGGHRVAHGGRLARLGHSDGRTEVGRLDEERKAKGIDRLLHDLGRPGGPVCQAPHGHRDGVVVQHRPGNALVHADGGRQHARPHVGQAQCLEVALDHAVLAEGPVQDGEDDGVGRHVVPQMRELGVRVLGQELVGRLERFTHVDVDQLGLRVDPLLGVGQPDEPQGPASVERGLRDPARRDARDLVLGRGSSIDDHQRSGFRHRTRLYNRPPRPMRAFLHS